MNPIEDFMDTMWQVQTATDALWRRYQTHLPPYAKDPHPIFLRRLAETVNRFNSQLTPLRRSIDVISQAQPVHAFDGSKKQALDLMVKAKNELDNILQEMSVYRDIPPPGSDPSAQSLSTSIAGLDASIGALRADLASSGKKSYAYRVQEVIEIVDHLQSAVVGFNQSCQQLFNSTPTTDLNARTVVNGLRAYPSDKIRRQRDDLNSLTGRIEKERYGKSSEARRKACLLLKEMRDDFRQHLGLVTVFVNLRGLPENARLSLNMMQTKTPQLADLVQKLHSI